MIFRVAILQMPSNGRDFRKNTETIISKMKEAAKLNADILLIPECFITGYILPIENHEAIVDNDPCIIEICNACLLYTSRALSFIFIGRMPVKRGERSS